MAKPLSLDLRQRVIGAIEAGMSRRAAAKRFGVGVSSVIRWDVAHRATGSFAPKAPAGNMRSERIEARGDKVLAAFEEERDPTLMKLSPGRIHHARRSGVPQHLGASEGKGEASFR